MKKTKIVCTMGPNSNDLNVMRELVKGGMDIARFNFSHGDHEEQKGRMDALKKIREEEGKHIAILLDTKGPEIRTGLLKDGQKVQLTEGEEFILTTETIEGDNKRVSITYEGLVEDAVVLMDIQMPIMDGYEATKQIRRLSQRAKANVPILAMTANAFAEERKKALSCGMNGHVSKPIDVNVLFKTIETILR